MWLKNPSVSQSIYRLPSIFAQGEPGNAIRRAHRRINATVNQSRLALKEGLTHTGKHGQNNDESYLSSQMWTLKPCQGLFECFLMESRGCIPGAWLTPSWSQVLVNVLCLQICELDELWQCLPIAGWPVCLGFGHCSHQWHFSTWHTNKHR